MTKPNTKPTPPHQPSNKPGGFLASPELDRANTFASMRVGLEAVLAGDRNAVSTAVSAAVATYSPEFFSHAKSLLDTMVLVATTGRARDLEIAIASKIDFFKWAESSTLSTVPRHSDADQLHAAELHRQTKAEADRFRVRHNNY